MLGSIRLGDQNGLPAAGRGSDQKRRKARGHVAHHVVEPRGRPSEFAVPFVPVPDHAVGGVHELVREQSRQAQQQEPESRGHHAVGKALRSAFDCGPPDSGGVKLPHIPADNPSDCGPAFRQAVSQPVRNRPDMVDEALLAEDRGSNEDFEQPHIRDGRDN